MFKIGLSYVICSGARQPLIWYHSSPTFFSIDTHDSGSLPSSILDNPQHTHCLTREMINSYDIAWYPERTQNNAHVVLVLVFDLLFLKNVY